MEEVVCLAGRAPALWLSGGTVAGDACRERF